MPNPFDPCWLKDIPLANRFVRSATWEGMATQEGAVTDKLKGLMCRLARGSVGLIISGHAYVQPQGQAGPWQLGVYSDDLLPGLSHMTRMVHDAGGRIVLQLAHAGCQAPPKLTGQPASGPSALSQDPDGFECTQMDQAQIAQVRDAFAAAALRAKKAGFDGVQIHAAHGYLLSQFLSPYFNRRTDQYGGSLENRARLVIEILRAIREQVGERYLVLIKLNAQDFLQPGLTAQEMVEVASLLENEGLDAVELSGGTPLSGEYLPVRKGRLTTAEEEAYYQEEARQYKARVSLPLILVGGIRSVPVARNLVNSGTADFIAMSRPLIREPELIRRWQRGNQRPATCTSDNLCFKPAVQGEGIYCLTEVKEKKGIGH